MDKGLVKRRHRELSKQQAIFIANRETGKTRKESAIAAGYSPESTPDQHPTVSAELENARKELAESSGITREYVLEGLKRAADIAETMADPQAMVRAFSEMGKMCGHYAPEVRKVLHGMDAESRALIKGLSDEELHKLAKGRIIEGEFKREQDAAAATDQV